MSALKKFSMPATLPSYPIGEEIANSVIHGIGALAAIAGLVLLGLKVGGFWNGYDTSILDITGVLLFTITMTGMFLISTLYHAIQHQGAKRILRKLDHSVIFVFIAGTYTPLCLSGLGGAWGWSLFGFQWSLALLGIILNIVNNKAFKKIQLAIYLLMGWAVVVGFVPLVRSLPAQSIILILAGGIAYTLGIFWYRRKDIRFSHAIWHIFVIIGAVCHWFSVWYLF